MNVKLKIENLGHAEENAREILKHIEAIQELQRSASYQGIQIEVELGESE